VGRFLSFGNVKVRPTPDGQLRGQTFRIAAVPDRPDSLLVRMIASDAISPHGVCRQQEPFPDHGIYWGCLRIAHAVVPISLAGLAAQFDISSLFGNGRGRKALDCELLRLPPGSNQRQIDLTYVGRHFPIEDYPRPFGRLVSSLAVPSVRSLYRCVSVIPLTVGSPETRELGRCFSPRRGLRSAHGR
jgi:hypothetical protein